MDIEHEAARVAAAFGVTKYKRTDMETVSLFEGRLGNVPIWWHVKNDGWSCITIGDGRTRTKCQIAKERGFHFFKDSVVKHTDKMARGLYCLDFDDPHVLALLPELSMHEQVEARLSMPREFWPKKWVDELEAIPV